MLAIQCKMARVALGITGRELADMAKVSPDTVARLERGEALKERTVDALRQALEAAGCIFIAENGEGPGVRLRKHGRGREDARIMEEADRTLRAEEGVSLYGNARSSGRDTEMLASDDLAKEHLARAKKTVGRASEK